MALSPAAKIAVISVTSVVVAGAVIGGGCWWYFKPVTRTTGEVELDG